MVRDLKLIRSDGELRCMQIMLITGVNQIEELLFNLSFLYGAVFGQYSAANHTRHFMQLVPNRLFGT